MAGNKLIFSGQVQKNIKNHILKVPDNPLQARREIQDGVQNGRQIPNLS